MRSCGTRHALVAGHKLALRCLLNRTAKRGQQHAQQPYACNCLYPLLLALVLQGDASVGSPIPPVPHTQPAWQQMEPAASGQVPALLQS